MRFRNMYQRERGVWAGRNREERREMFVQSVFADIEHDMAAERDRTWRTQREIGTAIEDVSGASLESRCQNAERQFADIEAKQAYRLNAAIEEELARRREKDEMRQRAFTQGF